MQNLFFMSLKSIYSVVLLFVVILFTFSFRYTAPQEFKGNTVMISGADGIQINADIYESVNAEAPVILLFHQARYSRGEYREIAPKLVGMGYTCIAIDQRSGKEVNGVENESFIQAESMGLATEYPDAFVDVQSTLDYAKKNYKKRKIIVWGSSYSAALTFVLASKNSGDVSAILAFSPGEYFTFEDKSIVDFASTVQCPVFITSAKNESDKWEAIYEAVPSETKKSFLPSATGFHGSKALWEKNDGNLEYWGAVTEFLGSLK